MLKTNSKAFVEKLHKYITDHSQDELLSNYGISETRIDTFTKTAREIMGIYRKEKFYSAEYMQRKQIGEYESFKAWAQGLAMGALFLYYYNVSAVDLLGDMLEQTQEQRGKYNEQQAEETLTRLIYRELIKEL